MSTRTCLRLAAGCVAAAALVIAFRGYEAVGALLLLQTLPMCL